MLRESALRSWGDPILRYMLPHSRPGWIALWFFVAFAATFVTQTILFAFIGASPWQTLLYPLYPITSVGGGIAAVIAVVRHKDRGFLLLLPVLVALASVVFVVAEFVAPHE